MIRLKTLLLGLLAASAARAGELDSLAQLLPPHTPVYMETKNPPLEEFKQLAMWKCLEDPAVKKALERLSSADNVFTSQAVPLGSAGLVLRSDLRDLSMQVRYVDTSGVRSFRIHQRFAAAWVGMADGAIPVDAIGAVQIAGDPKRALETVKRIIAAATVAHGRHQSENKGQVNVDAIVNTVFSSAAHRDKEYTRFSAGEVELYMATLGNLLFVTTTEGRMRECIDRSLDGSAGSLAESPRFVDMVKKSRGTGSTSTVFAIQLDHALQALQQRWPAVAMAKVSMSAAGLDSLHTIASVSRVEGRGITNTLSLLIDRTKGAQSPFFAPGERARLGSLSLVPKDVIYVNCSRYNIAGLSAAFLEPAFGRRFDRIFGLRLKEDLVDLVGPEVTIVIAPNQGLIPDLGLVFESADANRLAKSLTKMAERIRWPVGTGVQTATIRGVPVRVLPLGHPRLTEIPIAPTFGVVDGRLLVTPSPIAFQHFVAVQQGDKPALSANRDFARLRELVPEDAEGISYLDLPRVIAFCYDTLVPILQGLPPERGGATMYELPEAEIFTRHLYGRIAWTEVDERGAHWISHSPMDMSGFTLASLGIGMALFASFEREPDVIRAPVPIGAVKNAQDDEATTCAANVRILAARLRYYRRQHKSLPKSLDALKAKHVPEDTFIVPGTDKEYVYLGPDGRNGVLLHGYPNGADKGICVLLVERMKVVRVTEADLKKMLARQSAPGGR